MHPTAAQERLKTAQTNLTFLHQDLTYLLAHIGRPTRHPVSARDLKHAIHRVQSICQDIDAVAHHLDFDTVPSFIQTATDLIAEEP